MKTNFKKLISLAYLFLMFFETGCLLTVTHKKILDYKMNDSTKIEIDYTGGGATAPDYLKLIKKNLLNNKSTTIKVLDGYTDYNVFHISALNDSVIILNIIDTAQFTVINRDQNFRININQIDTTFNKYK